MRNVEVFCWTFTPWLCTDFGSWARAMFTRFWTSTWARLGSVSIVK